jgi:hypothetical protein
MTSNYQTSTTISGETRTFSTSAVGMKFGVFNLVTEEITHAFATRDEAQDFIVVELRKPSLIVELISAN